MGEGKREMALWLSDVLADAIDRLWRDDREDEMRALQAFQDAIEESIKDETR